jgi:hypothetical protein
MPEAALAPFRSRDGVLEQERSSAVAAGKWMNYGKRLSVGQLWQAPLFCLGLMALIVVGSLHPFWGSNPTRRLERQLDSARRGLEQPWPDIDAVIAKAEFVLADDSATPVQQSLAHFLIGSAQLRRADQLSDVQALEAWEMARSHLETAEQQGVAKGYEPKLAYRLGKVYSKLNGEPQQIVNHLVGSVRDAADNPFEGYGLLAQAYLRLPKPDLRGALEATQKQLALPNIDETALAQPRLLCGDLYRRLEQPEEARKVLARIGPLAPTEVLFQARQLRAHMLQEQGYWMEAAQIWEQIKDDPRAGQSRGQILFALGWCYHKLDRLGPAQQAWEAAQKQEGEESQAAALGLAELRVRAGNPTAAFESFAAALSTISSAAEYHNTLISLQDTRNLIETGYRSFMQVGQYEPAFHLAHLYERIALPGDAQQLAGQAAEGWARAVQAQAKQTSKSEDRLAQEEEARTRFRDAGTAFEATATVCSRPADKADLLWRSARNYLDGQDPEHALPVLGLYVAQPGLAPERLGEAWYIRGEAFRSLRNIVAAQADYRHCEKFPGPFAYRARYQLALIEIDDHNLNDAEAHLTQNWEIMETASDADPEAQEKTLYALAKLLYQRAIYPLAFAYLEKALERFPNNAAALATRFQLAQCARQLAEDAGQKMKEAKTAEERAHYQTQRKRFLEKSMASYQKVGEEVTARGAKSALAADEETMGRLSAFAVAECRFDLGQFEDATLQQYEDLARRYKGQVEELIALQYVWQYYGFVKFKPDKARQTLDRIRDALQQMQSAAFDNSSEVRTRRWWDDWLREKSRPVP